MIARHPLIVSPVRGHSRILRQARQRCPGRMTTMRDWPGRFHVETLRLWPELAQTVSRIDAHPRLFSGALLIGSLSRGEGDVISDVDLIAVTQPNRWWEAWDARSLLSSGWSRSTALKVSLGSQVTRGSRRVSSKSSASLLKLAARGSPGAWL
jgi:hypothetical protein